MPPPMEGFKPFGIPIKDTDPVVLLYEEYEAIRLVDYEDLTQEEAAVRMNISRPTFTRLYNKARKCIAKAFVEGNAIFIQGGTYVTDDYWFKCFNCNEVMVTLKPLKSCRKCASDNIIHLNEKEDNGTCICLHCDIKAPHEKGRPCNNQKCPQCGKSMIREGSYHHQLYLKNASYKEE